MERLEGCERPGAGLGRRPVARKVRRTRRRGAPDAPVVVAQPRAPEEIGVGTRSTRAKEERIVEQAGARAADLERAGALSRQIGTGRHRPIMTPHPREASSEQRAARPQFVSRC
jgi:hypothetical protein